MVAAAEVAEGEGGVYRARGNNRARARTRVVTLWSLLQRLQRVRVEYLCEAMSRDLASTSTAGSAPWLISSVRKSFWGWREGEMG